MTRDLKERAKGMIAEIDASELAVRLIERGCHMKRTPGLTGRAAWEQIEAHAPEYIVRDFEAMAHIAIAYLSECVDALQRRN